MFVHIIVLYAHAEEYNLSDKLGNVCSAFVFYFLYTASSIA